MAGRKPTAADPPVAKPLTPSPIALHSARAQNTARDAAVWLGMAAALVLAWKLAPMIMLIIGGLVFAAGLQGAERLLARLWKVPHTVRMTTVIILVIGLLAGFVVFAGVQLTEQYEQLRATLTDQIDQLRTLANKNNVDLGTKSSDPVAVVGGQMLGSLASVREAVGSVAAGIGTLVFMIMFGIYIALDPRVYERGVEWLTPERHRAEADATLRAMARTLRHWVAGRGLAMAIEGVIIYIGLRIAGVPLAGLLALTTGLLVFIPTLGALIAGGLIVAIGFSAGTTTGLAAIALFAVVQFIEGYILTPVIEKRVVDLAPAVVLAAQLLFGVLFGIIGVALADPIVAMAKVALTRRSAAEAANEASGAGTKAA
jgi:predicted PurR-regulated permease PerM